MVVRSAELKNLARIIASLATDLARVPNWRVHHVGDADKLPVSLRTALEKAADSTATHTGLHVNSAVGYGGRHEITEAVRDIIREHQAAGRGIDSLADDMTLDNISGPLVHRGSARPRPRHSYVWRTAHFGFHAVANRAFRTVLC